MGRKKRKKRRGGGYSTICAPSLVLVLTVREGDDKLLCLASQENATQLIQLFKEHAKKKDGYLSSPLGTRRGLQILS